MSKQKYFTRIEQIEALQLVEPSARSEGTAHEIAYWCKGRAVMDYNSDTSQVEVMVTFKRPGTLSSPEEEQTIMMTEWLVKGTDGSFYVMTNKDFAAMYQPAVVAPMATCWFCLADTTNTKMSDDAKRCPECSSGYIGNSRVAEYDILKAAGAVRE